MSDLISGTAKIECLCCKASSSIPILSSPGVVDKDAIWLDHEDWCGFLKALQSSTATAKAWVEKNGYPIRFWIDGRPVPALHPSEDGWKMTKG